MYNIKHRPNVDDLLQAEEEDPSPQKNSEDRTVYTSEPFQNVKSLGMPVLADFRHALIMEEEGFLHITQPNAYHTPEILLGLHWGLACLVS